MAINKLLYSCSAFGICAVLGSLTVAHAQTAAPAGGPSPPTANTQKPAPALAEIVVTAQRRTQSLQDVGVSVTALNSKDLQNAGVANSKDLAKAVPGILFDATSSGGINAELSIRGISQTDFSSNQESPNSIYIDDVYLSSSNAAAFPLFDMNQVEVLRGPQGTLFGRASSGGLADFLPQKPTKDFSGYAEVGFGSYDQQYVETALGGPITDWLRFRISGREETADGWWKNTAVGGEPAFSTNFFGGRAQLEADLPSNIKARVEVSYDEDPRHDEGTYSATPYYIGANGLPTPVPANLDVYGTGPGNDEAGYRNPYPPREGNFNNVGYLENHFFSSSLYLNWHSSTFDLASITNYSHFGYNYDEDCDGGPVDYCQFPLTQRLEQWSQEIKANGHEGNLNWTTGIYYLEIKQNDTIDFDFPALTGSAYAFNDTNPIAQQTESIAVYGQAEYRFSPKWRAILGLRETHDVKTFSSQVYFYELGSYYGGTGAYDPPLLDYDYQQSTVGKNAIENADMWSGKAELDYQPDHNKLVYASVSRGIKGPGFNTNVSAGLTDAATAFRSEYVYAYELGAKLELFDRKLRVNSDIFYDDYHRFQGFAFTGLQGVVGNYGGYFTGFESEITAALPAGVTVSLGGDYLQTQLRNVPTAYEGVRNEQAAEAPHETVTGNIAKSFNIGPGSLRFQLSADYSGDRYASIDNNPATYITGSFEQNIRATYNIPNIGVELAFWVNNLSNANREEFAYDLTSSEGDVIRSFGTPRWFGGSIKKTF